MDNSKLILLKKAPVRQAVLKLALPTMLGMVVQTVYNLTDTFFVGQTGDKNLVAAISLVMPLFMAIQAFGNIFAVGTGSYISRKLGEKNFDEARRSNAVAIYLSVLAGLFLTALLLPLKTPLLQLMGTSEATYGPTAEYFSIIIGGAALLVLQVSLAGLVRSEGATTRSMLGMVIGLGANIVLDPIFILTLDMGVAGAAWATLIGNALGVGFYVIHFLSKKAQLSVLPRDFKPNARMLAETFKIGIPSALSTMIMGISMAMANILAAGYGDDIVAGNGIQMRVNSMCIMLMIGMAQGYQPFAGYNYGAKNYQRLISGLKTTMLYNTILACFFTLLFIFFGRDIVSLFIDDAPTIEAGTKIIHAFVWGAPFIGLQMTLMVTFQATGKAIKSMVISLGRQCLLYIPLLFTLNSLFGFNGYIYAQPAADILVTVVAVLMSLSFLKEMRALHEDTIKLPAVISAEES
jgi:putative MATE family efflux protein